MEEGLERTSLSSGSHPGTGQGVVGESAVRPRLSISVADLRTHGASDEAMTSSALSNHYLIRFVRRNRS